MSDIVKVSFFSRALIALVRWLIRLYQLALSPFTPPS